MESQKGHNTFNCVYLCVCRDICACLPDSHYKSMGQFQSERKDQAPVDPVKVNSQVKAIHDPDNFNQTSSLTDGPALTFILFLPGPPHRATGLKATLGSKTLGDSTQAPHFNTNQTVRDLWCYLQRAVKIQQTQPTAFASHRLNIY